MPVRPSFEFIHASLHMPTSAWRLNCRPVNRASSGRKGTLRLHNEPSSLSLCSLLASNHSQRAIRSDEVKARRGLLAVPSSLQTPDSFSLAGLQDIARHLIRAALQRAAQKKEVQYSEMLRMPSGQRRSFHDDITVVVHFIDHMALHRRPMGLFRQVSCRRHALRVLTSAMQTTGLLLFSRRCSEG